MITLSGHSLTTCYSHQGKPTEDIPLSYKIGAVALQIIQIVIGIALAAYVGGASPFILLGSAACIELPILSILVYNYFKQKSESEETHDSSSSQKEVSEEEDANKFLFSHLIPTCDRFIETVPSDGARIYLADHSPTNGARLFWSNPRDVLIAGPGDIGQVKLFWSLVYENQVSVIVRIGKQSKNPNKKLNECCIPYTPTPTNLQIYDAFSVERCYLSLPELISEEGVTREKYIIKDKSSDAKRKLNVVEVSCWVDHEIWGMEQLLHLIQTVDKLAGKQPVLAHCRGGFGRSATFLLCRHIYHLFLDKKPIDVDSLVEQLRLYRPGAVQPNQIEMSKNFLKFLQSQ